MMLYRLIFDVFLLLNLIFYLFDMCKNQNCMLAQKHRLCFVINEQITNVLKLRSYFLKSTICVDLNKIYAIYSFFRWGV